MKFNSFYFLHIPKTGGRFFTRNVLKCLDPHFKEHGVDRITDYYSHTGWHFDVKDDTYVTTIFRDPAEQMVSLYAHVMTQSSNGERRVEPLQANLKKSDLFKYYENIPWILNFQSKHFLLEKAAGLFISEEEIRNKIPGLYGAIDVEMNKTLLFERINRTNLMLRQDLIHGRGYEFLADKITDDMGLPRIEDHGTGFEWNSTLYNPDSSVLYSSLTAKEKTYLREMSYLDTEIFETESFYWK